MMPWWALLVQTVLLAGVVWTVIAMLMIMLVTLPIWIALMLTWAIIKLLSERVDI
jgi:hypothetical protein